MTMDFIDRFFSRTYETRVNKEMLAYNYIFPELEVEEYVQQALDEPLKKFVKWAIDSESVSFSAKDVFQFSSFEDGTGHICQALSDAGNPGVTFIQAGKMLLNDGKQRTDMAYTKYGENHLKTAESLGLLFELTHIYFLSCIGVVYLRISAENRKRLIVRLLLRDYFIINLLRASSIGEVNARQFMGMLSDSTYVRRRSNIKYILRYMQGSTEYDFSELFNGIHFA